MQDCSKCGKGLDTTGFPLWCRKCRAKYKRDYNGLKGTMDTQKGFHKGIAAMRKTLAEEFDKLGSGSFEGYEVAALIRQAPGPQREDEEKPEQNAVRLSS